MKLCLGVLALAVAAGGAALAQQPMALHLEGAYPFTHDPSMAQDGKTYYVFATGKAPDGGQFPVRCSEDLTHWRMCGHIFDEIPDWIAKRSPGTRDLWAPDVTFEHGEYRLYYAYSLFGKNTSGIGLSVNKTLDRNSPDYKWVDRGLIVESKESDNFNAIDPNYIEDAKGRGWLVFGSFWGGIRMIALDAKTGQRSAVDTKVYPIATRSKPENSEPAKPGLPPNYQAIEAPYIVRHGEFFYLFVSWDLCCRGTHSTYRTMVGRSKDVTGPYVDRDGKPMMEGGGTQILSPNDKWLGPGGESVFQRKSEPDLLVFHAYDATTGRPAMHISTIAWKDGWPVVTLGDE